MVVMMTAVPAVVSVVMMMLGKLRAFSGGLTHARCVVGAQ
jgi:hypothetical protein